MATIRQTTVIFDKTPKITQKQKISRVSTKIIEVKHAPEGTNPTTVEEFMKVAKQYWEFGVDIKQRRAMTWDTYPHRCLFSDSQKAEKARKEVEKIMMDRNIKEAMENYKKSKWKDEAEKWGDEYIDEEEGAQNEY